MRNQQKAQEILNGIFLPAQITKHASFDIQNYMQPFTEETKKKLVKVAYSTYVERDNPARKWHMEYVEGRPYIVALEENIMITADSYDIREAAQGAMIYKGDVVIDDIPLPVTTDVKAVVSHLKGYTEEYKHLPPELFLEVVRKSATELSTRFTKAESGSLAKTAARKKKVQKSTEDKDTEESDGAKGSVPNIELYDQTDPKQLELLSGIGQQSLSDIEYQKLLARDRQSKPIKDLVNNVLPSKEQLLSDAKGTKLEPMIKTMYNEQARIDKELSKTLGVESLAALGEEFHDVMTGKSSLDNNGQKKVLMGFLHATITVANMARSMMFPMFDQMASITEHFKKELEKSPEFKTGKGIAFSPELQVKVQSLTKLFGFLAATNYMEQFKGKKVLTVEDYDVFLSKVKGDMQLVKRKLSEVSEEEAKLLKEAGEISLTLASNKELKNTFYDKVGNLLYLSEKQKEVYGLINIASHTVTTSVLAQFMTPEGVPGPVTTQTGLSMSHTLHPLSSLMESIEKAVTYVPTFDLLKDPVINKAAQELGIRDQVVDILAKTNPTSSLPIFNAGKVNVLTAVKTAAAKHEQGQKVVNYASEILESIGSGILPRARVTSLGQIADTVLLNLQQDIVRIFNNLKIPATEVNSSMTSLRNDLKSHAQNIQGLITKFLTSTNNGGSLYQKITQMPDMSWEKLEAYRDVISSFIHSLTENLGKTAGLLLYRLFKRASDSVQIPLSTLLDAYQSALTDMNQWIASVREEQPSMLDKFKNILTPQPSLVPIAASFKQAAKKEPVVDARLLEASKELQNLYQNLNQTRKLVNGMYLHYMLPFVQEFTSQEILELTSTGVPQKDLAAYGDIVHRLAQQAAVKLKDYEEVATRLISKLGPMIVTVQENVPSTTQFQYGEEIPNIKVLVRALEPMFGKDLTKLDMALNLLRNTNKGFNGILRGLIGDSQLVPDAIKRITVDIPGRVLEPGQPSVDVGRITPEVERGIAAYEVIHPIYEYKRSAEANELEQKLLDSGWDKFIQELTGLIPSSETKRYDKVAVAEVIQRQWSKLPVKQRETMLKKFNPSERSFIETNLQRPNLAKAKEDYEKEMVTSPAYVGSIEYLKNLPQEIKQEVLEKVMNKRERLIGLIPKTQKKRQQRKSALQEVVKFAEQTNPLQTAKSVFEDVIDNVDDGLQALNQLATTLMV
jgi:hypothetical protein